MTVVMAAIATMIGISVPALEILIQKQSSPCEGPVFLGATGLVRGRAAKQVVVDTIACWTNIDRCSAKAAVQ